MQPTGTIIPYYAATPDKEIDRLKEATKLRSSPPSKKIYEVLTETPAQTERQTRSPFQEQASRQVKRSELDERSETVKSKLEDLEKFVVSLKSTIESRNEPESSSSRERTKLVEHFERLKAAHPIQRKESLPESRFEGILAEPDFVPNDVSAKSKVKVSDAPAIPASKDSSFAVKPVRIPDSNTVSLGDFLESLNDTIKSSHEVDFTSRTELPSFQSASFDSSQAAVSFEAQTIEQVERDAEIIIEKVVETVSRLPLADIQSGPSSVLDGLLEQTIKDIEGNRSRIEAVGKRPAESQKRDVAVRESEVTAYTPREAEIALEWIANAAPTEDLKAAQYKLTPNAVSQLLF